MEQEPKYKVSKELTVEIKVTALNDITEEDALIIAEDFSYRLQGYSTTPPEILKGAELSISLNNKNNIE